MSQYTQNTPIAEIVEPVALNEIKAHLRIEDNEDAVYLLGIIKASREVAENYTECAIVDRSFTLNMSNFKNEIEIRRNPIDISTISIAYTDDDGADQVVTNFMVDSNRYITKIKPDYGELWPAIKTGRDKVRITFTAGYKAAFGEIPSDIKHAIMMIAGTMYDQRENHIVGVTVGNIPMSAEFLLSPYLQAHS